jgi:hypothetical protein
MMLVAGLKDATQPGSEMLKSASIIPERNRSDTP